MSEPNPMLDTTSWWISNRKMSVMATERGGIIVDASPIVRMFVGQPLERLVTWMQNMKRGGGSKCLEMTQINCE